MHASLQLRVEEFYLFYFFLFVSFCCVLFSLVSLVCCFLPPVITPTYSLPLYLTTTGPFVLVLRSLMLEFFLFVRVLID